VRLGLLSGPLLLLLVKQTLRNVNAWRQAGYAAIGAILVVGCVEDKAFYLVVLPMIAVLVAVFVSTDPATSNVSTSNAATLSAKIAGACGISDHRRNGTRAAPLRGRWWDFLLPVPAGGVRTVDEEYRVGAIQVYRGLHADVPSVRAPRVRHLSVAVRDQARNGDPGSVRGAECDSSSVAAAFDPTSIEEVDLRLPNWRAFRMTFR
jgi:hypothetical protein